MSSLLVEKGITAMLCMQRQCWEQGVGSHALIIAGKADLAVLFAHDAVVRQIADGRPGMVESMHASNDPASHGEELLFAAKATGEAMYADAAVKLEQWMLHTAPRAADGTLYHNTDKNQVWSDSLYMLPPALAHYGHFDEAMRQIRGMRKRLWNAGKKLYAHIWDEDEGRLTRALLWGGGNGWAAAGFARLIGMLPETMAAEKQELLGYLIELLEGCRANRRADGLFHDIVDDPTSFVETNLGQMVAYAIYHSVTGGWLDASWLADAEAMRNAAVGMVDKYGIVRGACSSPHFNKSGTSTEAQAFLIMMETAREACPAIK